MRPMVAVGRWRPGGSVVAEFLSTLALTLLAVPEPALAQQRPEDRSDFWRSSYAVLEPDSGPRVARAHEVFDRVLRAAGSRPGVKPRLLVIKKASLEVIALPDGGVILASLALDRCYENSTRGDDRLAFVLGHEIAHQLKEDFWHARFFQALVASASNPQDRAVRDEVRTIAGRTDDRLAKELAADDWGVVYAAQAGFDPAAVLAEDGRVSFFVEWVAALDPTRVTGSSGDSTHPSPAQRAETVKVRLRAVLDAVEIFDLGMLLYQAGDYEHAAAALRVFLETFPSREVYHDIGASHHQLALRYYHQWKRVDSAGGSAATCGGDMPFRLPLVADPRTRASGLVVKRGADEGKGPEALFREQVARALESYREALARDPAYTPSVLNLASALVLSGYADEAVGVLKRSLAQGSPSAEVLDVLGVAYHYQERPAKAREALLEARKLDPRFAPALFNLARLTALEGNAAEAKMLWTQYLELDASSSWAAVARQNAGDAQASPPAPLSHGAAESVAGGRVGKYDDEMQKVWGTPRVRKVPLGDGSCQISYYPNEIMTASFYVGRGLQTKGTDDKIVLIAVTEGSRAKTARGVQIGTSRAQVESAYGPPTEVLDLTVGTVFVYGPAGIAFRIVNGRVASWVVSRG